MSIFTGRSSHIIIGPVDKVGAIFANKEARAVELSETVKKARADVNDSGAASGRDLAKPIVSNVTVSAVQANMTSPRAPSISEDNDQAQPDQKTVSTSTPAKVYTYNSSTMPNSNVFHGGRARATFAQLRVHGGRARNLLITYFAQLSITSDVLSIPINIICPAIHQPYLMW